ncbi:DUF4083 family protein [Lysinibacillus sp. 38-6]|uniref:DUF4083 family protein n=1 Tax=Lysinibacillus sp. 38-6 TaxID=3385991 RepID=UPI0039089E3C
MESLYSIIVILLIVLFFISFALFIRRLIINSSVKANNLSDLEKKMDRLIEQNDQLFLLLKEKNR